MTHLGKHNNATLHAVTDDGLSTVFVLDLDDILVSSIFDKGADGFTVTLDYGSIEIQTKAVGAPAFDSAFQWDRQIEGPGTAATGALPPNPSVAGGILPEIYFMAVSGLNGGSTDPNHLGWFKLTDFQFSLLRDVDAAATPQSIGRADFARWTRAG